MDWQTPPLPQVWKAVDCYLSIAYPNGKPSAAAKSRLDALQAIDNSQFYNNKSWERDDADSPHKLSLRLGNRFYPHMKLVIEPAPDGHGCLFRADTHDKHIHPSENSPEYASFKQLMEANRTLSESIEAAWENAGLPTFKQYLFHDLERRTAEQYAAH